MHNTNMKPFKFLHKRVNQPNRKLNTHVYLQKHAYQWPSTDTKWEKCPIFPNQSRVTWSDRRIRQEGKGSIMVQTSDYEVLTNTCIPCMFLGFQSGIFENVILLEWSATSVGDGLPCSHDTSILVTDKLG
jgi:hypothetical protein